MADVDVAELERYLRIFQENPDSRVFAPLADMYRRLGRLREAELICREGLERHPYYAGGRVALAHILLDSSRLDEALGESESVVTYYPDNLLARKILIRALGLLGQKERAEREWLALQQLAPSIADDADLKRAISGARGVPLNRRPGVEASAGPRMSLMEHQWPEPSKSEDSGWEASRVAAHRRVLLLKRKILEAWIERLGTPPSMG
jgi:tetratricopeptide (TPR) repeat protein